MKLRRFNNIDREIIRTLYYEGIPMTIGEISQKTQFSWITVKKHISKLLKLGLVEEIKIDDRKNPKLIWNFNEFGNLAAAST